MKMYNIKVTFGIVDLGEQRFIRYTRKWTIEFKEVDGYGHAERKAWEYLNEMGEDESNGIDIDAVSVVSMEMMDPH